MDALPVDAIVRMETELLQRVQKTYSLSTDTLFYDTTNFFTCIATTNQRCSIVQRGMNKQKRYDLRQMGLAMVVTREDWILLFHLTYEGNRHDAPVFKRVLQSIQQRLEELSLDLTQHTLVFDRGNNSKTNLATIQELDFHYVAALTPCHHKELMEEARKQFELVVVNAESFETFREKRKIWGETRTVVVYVSEQLKEGQLRGIHQVL